VLTEDLYDNISELAKIGGAIHKELFPTLSWKDLADIKFFNKAPLIFFMGFEYKELNP
jgi:hypothetical protein